MVNYVTIADARTALKGSVIVKMVSLGDLASGTGKDGKEWKKQSGVVKDNSDVQEITFWGSDIGKMDIGKYYRLENPYWSVYNEEPQLSLGKYCKIHDATEADLLVQQTLPPAPTATNQNSDEYMKQRQEELHKQAANLGKVPKSPEDLIIFCSDNVTLLEQIRVEVEANLGKWEMPPFNGQKVGMITRALYDEYKKKVSAR